MDDIDKKIKHKKEFIEKQFLSEDIKNNIKQSMKNEYQKKEVHSSSLYKKIIASVACILIISTVTFAGNIGDFITNIFKNTEINKEQIINPNSIVEINSEYVTCNGVSLNVAYMYEDEEYLYIVMNVKDAENINDLVVDEIRIRDIKNNIQYDYQNIYDNNIFLVSAQYKNDSKNIFIKFKKNKNVELMKELELNIINLTVKDKNLNLNKIVGEWIFKIEKP